MPKCRYPISILQAKWPDRRCHAMPLSALGRKVYDQVEAAAPTASVKRASSAATGAPTQQRHLGQFAPSLQGVGYGESNTVTGLGSPRDPNGECVPCSESSCHSCG